MAPPPPLAAALSPAAPAAATSPFALASGAASSTSPFSMSAGGLFGKKQPLAAPAGSAPSSTPAGGTLSLTELEAQVAAPATAAAPCRPYDVAAYLGRLATFRAGPDWFNKPPSLSPPVCCRYGWTLAGHELLSCGVCSSFIKAPSQLTPDAAATLASQLATAHAELCPWKGHPSPPTVSVRRRADSNAAV